MKPIGLYLHIPFCDGKCRYCSFFSRKRSEDDMEAYTLQLISAIRSWGMRVKRPVATVYFGGGTPSLLGHERLIRILSAVRESFAVAESAQITVEVNPSSAVRLDFSAMRKAGFDRLSVGLQSANDDELKLLGRRHSADDVRRTVTQAQNAGFDNISLDVMLAIPGQTIPSLERTIAFCVGLNVQHISAYILKIEEGTPFWRDRDKLALFSDDEQAAFYEYTVHRLGELGYEQYEISNFSKNGYPGLHNLIYWHDEEYLGIGPSAHSFLDGRRFYYPDSFESFARGEILEEGLGGDPEEYIMLALRLSEGLVFERYHERFGVGLSQKFFDACRTLQDSGYVRFTPDSVALTAKGFLVSNSVIGYLLENT